MGKRFQGKRVLITECETNIGPALENAARDEGAIVIADNRDLTKPFAVQALVQEAGHIDVLVANLAAPYTAAYAREATEQDFVLMHEHMVLPLFRLMQNVLPQMYARRNGKIVVMGSAWGLKGVPMRGNYAAARGAQLAYVRTVGLEAIRHNVNVNATAQTFVDNPTYYSTEYQQTGDFKSRLRDLPIGRLSKPQEFATLVLFLASPDSDFFVGQIVPYSRGFIN